MSSGSGIHGYWLLEQDLHSPEDRSTFGGHASLLLRKLRRRSRAEPVPHHASARDIQLQGRPKRQAASALHALRVRCGHCDIRWRRFLRGSSRREEPRRKQTGRVICRNGRLPADQLRSRPAKVAELSDRLASPSRDRSRRDFAIVCDLLRLGLAKEEIWQLVSGSSKFESAGRPYFDLTITNAERTVILDGTTVSRSRAST